MPHANCRRSSPRPSTGAPTRRCPTASWASAYRRRSATAPTACATAPAERPQAPPGSARCNTPLNCPEPPPVPHSQPLCSRRYRGPSPIVFVITIMSESTVRLGRQRPTAFGRRGCVAVYQERFHSDSGSSALQRWSHVRSSAHTFICRSPARSAPAQGRAQRLRRGGSPCGKEFFILALIGCVPEQQQTTLQVSRAGGCPQTPSGGHGAVAWRLGVVVRSVGLPYHDIPGRL